MKYFWLGLAVYLGGAIVVNWTVNKINRWLFIRKMNRIVDRDDKALDKARKKGRLP